MASNSGNSEKVQSMGNDCPFGLLFRKNVEHILEEIFTSIDYATLRRCHIVCREWNTYLKSDSFLRAAKLAFPFDMWADVDQIEIKTLIHAAKKPTTNGEEVVYLSSDWKSLFYITSDGTRKSVYLGDLPIHPIRFTSTTVKLLKKSILIIARLGRDVSGKVEAFSISKKTMEVHRLYTHSYVWSNDHFHPSIGHYLVMAVPYKEPEVNVNTMHLMLFHVSVEHEKEDCWARPGPDQDRRIEEFKTACCSARKFHEYRVEHHEPRDSYCKFSADGSRMVFFRERSKICAFAIENDAVPMIWTSDVGIHRMPEDWFVTSGYVLIFNTGRSLHGHLHGGTYLELLDMRSGSHLESKSIRWSSMDRQWAYNPNLPEPPCDRVGRVFITERYLLTTMNSLLQILDLKTLDAKMYNTRAGDVSILSVFNEGKVVAMKVEGSLSFSSLKSGDPEKLFMARRVIKLDDRRSAASNSILSHEIKQFHEVTKDLCFREVYTSNKSNIARRKRFEIMALKPPRLSKAVETWLNFVERRHY